MNSVRIYGTSEFEIKFDRLQSILEKVNISTDTEVEVDTTLSLTATGSAAYEQEIELTREQKMYSHFVMVAQVPVYIEVTVQPIFIIEATIDAEATLDIDIKSTLRAEIEATFELDPLKLDATEKLSGDLLDIRSINLSGSFAASSVGRLGARFSFKGMC